LAIGIIRWLLTATCLLSLTLPVAAVAPAGVEQRAVLPADFGSILYVGGNGPGNYSRIQDAVDNASAGDTVFVYAGTYRELVTVRTKVHLVGQSPSTTIIDGEYKGNVVHIRADGTTMAGFTVQNSRHHIMAAGILVWANHTSISNCVVWSHYNGIYLSRYNTRNGHNLVRNNWIHHNFDGVKIVGNSYNEVSNNTIMYSEAEAIFAGGDFVFPCHHNTIADNILDKNAGGICFSGDSSQMLVTRNIITNNVFIGLWLNCWDSVFSWNSIRNSGDFAVLSEESSNNTFLHNDFIEAGTRLMFVGGHELPNTLRGNYWGRPRILPKIVIGHCYSTILLLQVDLRPAWKPNVVI
jgi:parallel beta-helix repeat protein